MAKFRKIDPQFWNDTQFRMLWEKRWSVRSRVPKSMPWPLRFIPLRERECLSTRNRFRKIKAEIFRYVANRFGERCLACGGFDIIYGPRVRQWSERSK